MAADPRVAVQALRACLDHPVIDGDGHLIETMTLFTEYLEKLGGRDLVEGYSAELKAHPTVATGNAETGDMRGAWWGVTNDAYDLATVMVPRLLHRRLEEIGIDYAILYPTLGLALPTILDGEIRRAAVRALNLMNADLARDCADRLTVAAVIPMHTPEEAIAELEYCCCKLGYKAAMMPPGVARPIPALEHKHPEAFPYAAYFDCYGLDSACDYDPVWRKFGELRIAVTSHGGVGLRHLPAGRRSPSNYMYNHIGAHAYQQGELCRSLVMGGVAARFPNLSFGFLEGGVGWACDLLHSLAEHWEKRNPEGLRNYDPSRLDRSRLNQLLREFGGERMVRSDRPRAVEHAYADGVPRSDRSLESRNEWARCGVSCEEDFLRMFGNFYFGCEADDPAVYRALTPRGNQFDARLQAFFSSDIGHWDVPDLKQVVLESHTLVDRGLLAAADYRDFVFTNPAKLHLKANRDFFAGTAVAGATQALAA